MSDFSRSIQKGMLKIVVKPNNNDNEIQPAVFKTNETPKLKATRNVRVLYETDNKIM